MEPDGSSRAMLSVGEFRLAADTASGPMYVHAGLEGSVIALTNVLGDLVERYRYTAFGLLTVLDAEGEEKATPALSPWLYHGRLFEESSGLYWMRMRHYSPQLGRFLQPDPAGIAGGINLYAYSNNNPLRYFDPWGLWPAPDATGGDDGEYGEADPMRNRLRSSADGFWRKNKSTIKKIKDLSEIENPHARRYLESMRDDPFHNELARKADSRSGYADIGDRVNNKITEYGAVAIISKDIVVHPELISSSDRSGYRDGANSLDVSDAFLSDVASQLGVEGQYSAGVVHGHGGSGPLSEADAVRAVSMLGGVGGVVVATDGSKAYIAIGVAQGGKLTCFEADKSILGL